ncbi:hypothetical protein [Pollutimonas bauzanensis]|uniref:Curlin associated repeat-containing protein n=1 Tax=Pollutimonas bauzanensis TaxID=658167 RepID=A0A1M6AJE3_9BURK|nr:hypothetical protein [Pollutimonas bauzanensis]SHI36639.1 Curlin associated repeat-containing protein [Pollutimonas bauzanensis]
MSIKLSALALGITLAYGATAAMAADNATVYQKGWYNDASIEQYDNNGAVATISQDGFRNDAVVLQEQVDGGLATIIQTASAGSATIDQGGAWGTGHWVKNGRHSQVWVDGSWTNGLNQTASINQASGSNNDAWATQTGSNVEASIYQAGVRNTAGIVQNGTGTQTDQANISQVGKYNDAYITQAGKNLVASISQVGVGQEATILQTGANKTATVSQSSGAYNTAYINQR